MRRFRQRSRHQRFKGFIWLAVGLICVGIWLAPHAQAGKQVASAKPVADIQQSQIFRDDLTVKKGQVYEQDVSVYDGDVTIENGGVIQGNLYVYSGDVEVQEGAQVKGDLAAFSGDVKIAGQIGGRIAAWSGNIELADSAVVGGDVSVLSGEIQQAPQARVHGNIVRGPNFKVPVPSIFQSPFGSKPVDAPPAPVPPMRASLGGTFLSFILRLLGAMLLTVVVALLAWLLYTVRPEFVRKVRATVEEQPALSFAVGAIVNVGLLFVTFLFFITVCLIPFGLATGLALVALNIVGWSAISLSVGERLSRYARSSAQPVAYLILGVIVTSGTVGLLWAFGCWRTCIFLVALLTSAPGVGALLVPWLKLGQQPLSGGDYPASPTGSSAPVAPMPPAAPVTPVGSTEPVSPVHVDDTFVQPSNAEAASGAAAEPDATTQMAASTGVYDEPATAEQPSAPPLTSDLEAVASVHEPAATPEPGADFTQIKGIGPTFAARLQAAGIRTFAQLAALTPEAVAAVVGWTPELVVSDNIIGQAKMLAE